MTEQLPPEPKEIKPHPYGVELGRLVAMLKDTKAPTIAQFLVHSFSRVSPSIARKLCKAIKVTHAGQSEEDRPARGRHALPGDSADEDSRAVDRLHRADRRGADPQGLAAGGAGRVLHGGHAPAGGLSRQSVPDRGRPGLRRRVAGRACHARGAGRNARRERRPHAAAVPHHDVSRARRRRGRQDSRGGQRRHARLARPAQVGRDRPVARGPAKRQHQRRPVDERAAVCQSRAVAVPGRRLRDHANRDGARTGGPTA